VMEVTRKRREKRWRMERIFLPGRNIKCDFAFVPDSLYRVDTRYKWGLPPGTNSCFSSSAPHGISGSSPGGWGGVGGLPSHPVLMHPLLSGVKIPGTNGLWGYKIHSLVVRDGIGKYTYDVTQDNTECCYC
jgi:hypothetical protein